MPTFNTIQRSELMGGIIEDATPEEKERTLQLLMKYNALDIAEMLGLLDGK
jgi:hypothetical protein